MEYWIALFTALSVLLGFILFIWKRRIKDNDMNNKDFRICIFLASTALLFSIVFSIDLPSALSGGEDIYVNELPTCEYWGNYTVYVLTDNEILRHLKGCDWNKYEKHGNYHIQYTKLTKIVLDVEKLD